MNNKKAFKLVELIIVIVIIAILAVSAGFMLVKWIGKSKNARVLADINVIQKALDIGYVENLRYPMPDDSITLTASGDIIGYSGYIKEGVTSNLS